MHDLSSSRDDFDEWIQQSRWANDLLDDFAFGLVHFIVAGRRGNKDHLIDLRLPFFELHRPIVQGTRQPKSVFH